MDSHLEQDSHSELGIESRSILKSITTEESKLLQSKQVTKSDLHYFRARYNYYRLSLLRLPQEERRALEPHLGRFLGRIIEAERLDNGETVYPRAFLQAIDSRSVGTEAAKARAERAQPLGNETAVVGEELQSKGSLASVGERVANQVPTGSEIRQDLEILRLALFSHPDEAARKILITQVEKLIDRLKA